MKNPHYNVTRIRLGNPSVNLLMEGLENLRSEENEPWLAAELTDLISLLNHCGHVEIHTPKN